MTAGIIATTTIIIVFSFIVLRKVRERKWGKCRSKKSMNGKVVIVTGANSGVGRATVEELTKRGARVIMACRDIRKAQIAANEILKKTTSGELKILKLDLASFRSIQNFVRNFLHSEKQLDVLINNAGIFQCPFMLTEDGFEMQFGVNYLGHFLLTKLLLEKLKQSSPSRIVNVSSELYKYGQLNFSELNSEDHYDKRKAYHNSKLANILFTRELSRRLNENGVTVYAVSPGMVWTNLGRHMRIPYWKMALFAPLAFLVIRTPYQGCQTVLHCALSEDVEKESGLYYANCCRTKPKEVGTDDAVARELWTYSEHCIKNLVEVK